MSDLIELVFELIGVLLKFVVRGVGVVLFVGPIVITLGWFLVWVPYDLYREMIVHSKISALASAATLDRASARADLDGCAARSPRQIIEGLNNTQEHVRLACAEILLQLPPEKLRYQKESAIDSLIDLLGDSSPTVRTTALSALVHITGVTELAEQSVWKKWRDARRPPHKWYDPILPPGMWPLIAQ